MANKKKYQSNTGGSTTKINTPTTEESEAQAEQRKALEQQDAKDKAAKVLAEAEATKVIEDEAAAEKILEEADAVIKKDLEDAALLKEKEDSAGKVRTAEPGKVAVPPTAMEQYAGLMSARDELYATRGMSAAKIAALKLNMTNIVVLVHGDGGSDIMSAYRKYLFKYPNRVSDISTALAARGFPVKITKSIMAMDSLLKIITSAERLHRVVDLNQAVVAGIVNDKVRRYIGSL